MKSAWITATLALVAVAYSMNAAAQLKSRGPSKVAFVSANRLVSSSPEMRTALGRFQGEQKQRVAELQAKQRALQETRNKLAQATSATDKTALIKQELDQKTELERLTAQAQSDSQSSQREMQQQIASHLKPVLDEVGKEQGLDVVLNADVAVLWGNTQLDITNEVIQRLNAPKTTPAPAPPKP